MDVSGSVNALAFKVLVVSVCVWPEGLSRGGTPAVGPRNHGRAKSSEGMRMVSGLIGDEVPRMGLRVRVPCPPLTDEAVAVTGWRLLLCALIILISFGFVLRLR